MYVCGRVCVRVHCATLPNFPIERPQQSAPIPNRAPPRSPEEQQPRSSNPDGQPRSCVTTCQPRRPHHRRPASSHRLQGCRRLRIDSIAQPTRLLSLRNCSPASPLLTLRSSHPHHPPPFRRGRLQRRQLPPPCRCALRGIEQHSYPRPPSGERRWRARWQDCSWDGERPCAARVPRIELPTLPTASRGYCHLDAPCPAAPT